MISHFGNQNTRHGEAAYHLPESIASVVGELAYQAHQAPGGDPVISAMSKTLLHLYDTNPLVAGAIDDVVTFRSMQNDEPGASEIVGIIRSSIMTDQLAQGQKPYLWTKPAQWRAPIVEFFEIANSSSSSKDEAKRADEITFNLSFRKVMTNPSSRAIGDELLMQSLFEQRFPAGYQWIDIGAALLEIPKQVLAKERYPFDAVTIVDALGGCALSGITEKANELLARPHKVRKCVAVDLIDPTRDEPTQQWTEGSLRPSEMSDAGFMEKFTGLTLEKPPELAFFTGDLLDEKILEEFYEKYGGEKADFITMSTMLHQLRKKDRDKMLSIGQELLTDTGVLAIKDFAYVQQHNPRSPRFFKNWHQPGRYRLIVRDMADSSGHYEELYHAKESRNFVIAAASGRIAVSSGNSLGFNELLAAA